jgi:hypothetical protein
MSDKGLTFKDESYRSGNEKDSQKGVEEGCRIPSKQDAGGSKSKDSGTKAANGGRGGSD